MKTISLTSPKTANPKAILLIGPPGGGKTTLSLQFPNAGVVDIDRNLDGPIKRLMKLDPKFEIRFDCAYQTSDGKSLPLADVWRRATVITDEMLKDEWVKTIVIDGLTMADDALYEHVLKAQNVSDMRIQDWVTFRAELIRLIMKCRAATKTFVMLCHEEPQIDDKGNVIRYVPSFRSKVSNFFGGFFTDMWRCTAVPCSVDKLHPDGVKFCLNTLPTSRSELKNSLVMPAVIEDVTYAKIAPYLT